MKKELWGTRPKPKKTKYKMHSNCLVKNFTRKTQRDKTMVMEKRVQYNTIKLEK